MNPKMKDDLKDKVLLQLTMEWQATKNIADKLKHHPDQVKSILIELFYQGIVDKYVKNKYTYWKIKR